MIGPLDLSNNSISELMDDLTSLTQLRTLNVSHNKIDQIESRLFAQFSQLISLDLSNNHLNEKLKPSVFESLPKGLNYLDISSKYLPTTFRKIHFNILGALPQKTRVKRIIFFP